MIIDERMSAFIDSLDSGNPAWLNEIEKFALETQVPIIRRSMQSLLKFLLKFTKPKSILEVGKNMRKEFLLQKRTSVRQAGKTGSLCWRVMLRRSCGNWKAPMM